MSNTPRKKIIQEYYSKRARDDDRQKARTWKTSQGFGAEVIEEMLTALGGSETKLLLEVGVGSGRNALPLLEKTEPWFVELDLSKEMLELAKTKLFLFKQNFDIIQGDTEHLPFKNQTFDAIMCMSTMHYFKSQEKILREFSEATKEKGIIVYGDLTLHELDNQRFLETLEGTISKAHARYYKPSEVKKIIETHGFRVCKMKTVAYRKSFHSLMEDKSEYFGVEPEMLHECVQRADADSKEQYAINSTGLTLFYTIVTVSR
jgi:ubiquinone/menaquinone biosynthesis C-methylase UbiE